MKIRRAIPVLLAVLSSVGAGACASQPHSERERAQALKHDPAFRAGYDAGYRRGFTDAEGLSNAYLDESGPVYQQATEGYTPAYGNEAKYQELFRKGYVAGYKAGWDFNSGQYCSSGCGGGGP